MTKFAENLQSWYMPKVVKGQYAQSLGVSSANPLPVHIPVLMPMIPFGVKKSQSRSLQKSCFCNDSKCKPPVASSIQTQNYLNVQVYENNKFNLPYFKLGAGFYIDALNGDYDQLRITNRQDDSFNPYH